MNSLRLHIFPLALLLMHYGMAQHCGGRVAVGAGCAQNVIGYTYNERMNRCIPLLTCPGSGNYFRHRSQCVNNCVAPNECKEKCPTCYVCRQGRCEVDNLQQQCRGLGTSFQKTTQRNTQQQQSFVPQVPKDRCDQISCPRCHECKLNSNRLPKCVYQSGCCLGREEVMYCPSNPCHTHRQTCPESEKCVTSNCGRCVAMFYDRNLDLIAPDVCRKETEPFFRPSSPPSTFHIQPPTLPFPQQQRNHKILPPGLRNTFDGSLERPSNDVDDAHVCAIIDCGHCRICVPITDREPCLSRPCQQYRCEPDPDCASFNPCEIAVCSIGTSCRVINRRAHCVQDPPFALEFKKQESEFDGKVTLNRANQILGILRESKERSRDRPVRFISNQRKPLTPVPLRRRTSKPWECILRENEGLGGRNCGPNVTRWHYDPVKGECRKFVFQGCGGNPNRFKSEAWCLRHCHEERPCVPLSEQEDSVPTPGCGYKTYTNAEGCPARKRVCQAKHGLCPQPSFGDSQNTFCINSCTEDVDCSGTKKCCFNGCGNICTDPILERRA